MAKSNWGHYNPVNIYFGRSERKRILDALDGKHCLIITTVRGRNQILNDEILSKLEKLSHLTWLETVKSNPDILYLKDNISKFAGMSFDAILAFGGGSVIDTAKTFSVALAKNLKNTELEILIQKTKLQENLYPIPLYAIPTTSGTGSEVTPFATIWDYQNKKKYSLSMNEIFPYIAIIDPFLTDNLPYDITLNSGIDAINQAAESIWNKNATPITIKQSTKALKLGFISLTKLLNGETEIYHRDAMAECSLLAGLSISQTRTAICHSISYPITAHFGVPHGLACGFTMPYVLRHNLNYDDGRLTKLAKDFFGENAKNIDLIELFDDLHFSLKIRKRIKSYIPNFEELDKLVHEMNTPNRAGNNMTKVNIEDIRSIIARSWST